MVMYQDTLEIWSIQNKIDKKGTANSLKIAPKPLQSTDQNLVLRVVLVASFFSGTAIWLPQCLRTQSSSLSILFWMMYRYVEAGEYWHKQKRNARLWRIILTALCLNGELENTYKATLSKNIANTLAAKRISYQIAALICCSFVSASRWRCTDRSDETHWGNSQNSARRRSKHSYQLGRCFWKWRM